MYLQPRKYNALVGEHKKELSTIGMVTWWYPSQDCGCSHCFKTFGRINFGTCTTITGMDAFALNIGGFALLACIFLKIESKS